MEKEWPPLETCPQYKCGLIDLIVKRKYPWEDEGKEDVWFNLYGPPGSVDVDVETMRKELLMAKMFLHQVRTTRGYGVTCILPLHGCSFLPVKNLNDFFVKMAMKLALTHISQKTGKTYELVKIENAVHAPKNRVMFLTFDAKMRYSVPETFYAMVALTSGRRRVMECLLKPDREADWGANEYKVTCRYNKRPRYKAF